MRFTVRRLMVAVVAAAGSCYVALQIHPALGALVGGVSGLALIRTFEAIDRSEAGGTPLRPTEVARPFLASAVIGLAILLASLLPAFCIFPVINRPRMHETPRVHPEDLVGIVIAALMGALIAAFLRRRLW